MDITLIIIHLGTGYFDPPTEPNTFSVEFYKLKEMSFYGYGCASYSSIFNALLARRP